MLEKVKELGLEKFAGDEDLADHFLAGFITQVMLEKEAAQPTQKVDYSHTLVDSVVSNVGKHIGGLAVNSAVSAGVIGYRFVDDHFRYNRFLKALEIAIASHPLLRESDKHKIQKYADTIYRFAPLVATDPNLLASVLANAVHGDGVDIMTIKSLTDLENRWRENGSVTPKTFV
jgi:hypothetical protein